MDVPAQGDTKRIHSSSASLFYLGPQWVGRCQVLLVRTDFLSLMIQTLSCLGNTFIHTPRNNVLLPSGHPLAQSSWCIKLTFMVM
jgi:hypothetical protein